MTFTKLVALIAVFSLGVQAFAYSDGTLRRTSDDVVQEGQNTNSTGNTSSKEINININAGQAQNSQATSQQGQSTVNQPATVVEAPPAGESRADKLRRARLGAEMQTEQTIVEKLEDSRLQEEKARAKRIFGDRLDPQLQQQQQTEERREVAPVEQNRGNNQNDRGYNQAPNVTIQNIIQQKDDTKKDSPTVVAPAAGEVLVGPKQEELKPRQEELQIKQKEVEIKPDEVKVKKQEVLISAPAPQAEELRERPLEPVQNTVPAVNQTVEIREERVIQPAVSERASEDGEESRAKLEEPLDENREGNRWYVAASGGNLNYQASNVQSNYGLGVAVGTLIRNRYAIELSYLYSNNNVTDAFALPIYHNMNQSDLTASAKYYLLPENFKPYVGASVSYINRQYTDRYYSDYAYLVNPTTSESTNAVDLGVLAGVDYQVSRQFLIGVGASYNFNAFSNSSLDQSSYGLSYDTRSLESIGYFTYLITVKFLF